jgi:hypothetical protein
MPTNSFLSLLILVASFSAISSDSLLGDVNCPEAGAGLLFKEGVEKVGEYTINSKWVYGKKDISAIVRVTQKYGMIGADEGVYAQLCTISKDKKIIIDDPVKSLVKLLPEEGGSEIDIEGATSIGDTYYLTGSHGLSKNSGDYQDSRHYCFRFTVNPESGRQAGEVEVSSMRSVFEKESILRPYYKRILQEHGVNIEGLASKDKVLFFGLRSPNIDGKAFVVEIEPEVLFDEKEEKAYKLHSLELGDGLGIREIVSIEQGFLMIAGNAGSEPGDNEETDVKTEVQDWEPELGFYLFFWDGRTYVQNIGEIPRDKKEYKAEGMVVLEESEAKVEVLVVFDGPTGGSPTIYRIFKRRG